MTVNIKKEILWVARPSAPENIFQQMLEDYERVFQVPYVAIDEKRVVHQLITPKQEDGAGILPQTLRWAWNHYLRDRDKHLREEWRGIGNFVVKINLYLRRAIEIGPPREMIGFGPEYKCLNPRCPATVRLIILRHEDKDYPVTLADMCWMVIEGAPCNHQFLRYDRWAELEKDRRRTKNE